MPVEGHMKSLSPMANQGFNFPSQIDFSCSIVSCYLPMFFLVPNGGGNLILFWLLIQGHILFHSEPYIGSLLATASGPQDAVSAYTNRSSLLRGVCFDSVLALSDICQLKLYQ